MHLKNIAKKIEMTELPSSVSPSRSGCDSLYLSLFYVVLELTSKGPSAITCILTFLKNVRKKVNYQ